MMAGPWNQFEPSGKPWDAYVKQEQVAPIVDKKASEKSLSDYASGLVGNIPGSAVQLASDMVQPVLHPIDTAKSLYSLGSGIIELAIPGEQTNEKTAKAVGQFFADRYGSLDQAAQTLHDDPLGLASDVAALFTGGSLAAVKASGKTAGILAKMSKAIDPVQIAAKATSKTVRGVAPHVLGMTTGVGGDVIREAGRAGSSGGDVADLLQRNLRGDVPVDDVLVSAKNALEDIRIKRGDEYRANLDKIKLDKTVLDFGAIDDALRDISKVGVFEGKVLNKSAQGVWEKISQEVDDWRVSDKEIFHTPEGLDALKKSIGDIRDSTDFGTPSRVMADKVYNAVKGVITKQAPEYSKMLREYSKASELITDIERTMSMKPGTSVDTQLRKLQSIMRDNVNTSYGRRKTLAGILDDGGANIMPQIAGQAASSFTPRGLQGAAGTANLLYQGNQLAQGALNPLGAAVSLAAQSPRLMGEASYYAGKGANALSRIPQSVPQAMYQSGRIQGLLEDK